MHCWIATRPPAAALVKSRRVFRLLRQDESCVGHDSGSSNQSFMLANGGDESQMARASKGDSARSRHVMNKRNPTRAKSLRPWSRQSITAASDELGCEGIETAYFSGHHMGSLRQTQTKFLAYA